MHAARSPHRRVAAALLAGILAALILVLTPASARADAKARHAAYDEKLTTELGMIAPPAAVAAFVDATKLSESDPARAIELFAKVSELAPKFTPAMRRRAMLLAGTNHRAEGMALAREALALESSTENRMALAMILSRGGEGKPPTTSELDEALGLARTAVTSAPKNVDAQIVLCDVLLAAQRWDDLRTSAALAQSMAPDEPEPVVYVAIAAAAHGDRAAAHAAIDKARALGLDAATIARLTGAIDATEPPLFRWGKRLLAVFVVWLAGLLALFGCGVVLSKMTLRIVARLTHDEQAVKDGALLRALYRGVLHAASLYYYASLPFVLVFVVAGGAAVVLGLLYIGRIPIYLLVVTGTVVLVTIVSVVKSIFVRRREGDPGIAVDLQKHARLRDVIHEVAERVGTRVVDEVFVVPGADIAVFERGSMLQQFRGKAERCLVLGVGVLDGMRLCDFKAILAHEYGHFSNRDTAGGGLALAVRRSVLHTAIHLAKGGAAVWYSPMWQFLIWYERIFLRISHGASRLQEVLADRIAALTYGTDAFTSGLEHVVRRSIEFDAHFDATIAEVVQKKVGLLNVYAHRPETTVDSEKIAATVEEVLEREPSPYDSHPRPVDRMAFARRLSGATSHVDDGTVAWSLFASRDEVELRMTAAVRENLAARGLIAA